MCKCHPPAQPLSFETSVACLDEAGGNRVTPESVWGMRDMSVVAENLVRKGRGPAQLPTLEKSGISQY